MGSSGPAIRRARGTLVCVVLGLVALGGCGMPAGPDPGQPTRDGTGPGRRAQRLYLSPEQELALGRKVFNEMLQKSEVVPDDHRVSRRVRSVGDRIVEAVQIRPLRREINLRLEGYRFDWTFKVIKSPEANAFCLPGGFVGVYTGLLNIAQDDDQLATVLSHEVAHALAHHASERLAQQGMLTLAQRFADDEQADLSPREHDQLISMLSIGGRLRGQAHNRFQESEADHIGVFLMTFARYDPDASVVFWERMARASARRGSAPPEILSDHPSDHRRIQHLRGWTAQAKAAKRAFDEGRIAPEAR